MTVATATPWRAEQTKYLELSSFWTFQGIVKIYISFKIFFKTFKLLTPENWFLRQRFCLNLKEKQIQLY